MDVKRERIGIVGCHGGPDMAVMIGLRHLAFAAFLLAGCTPGPGPERVVEQRVDAAPAPRGAGLLRRAMTEGHDRARSAKGLPALAWDETLVASARAYASEMARTGRFEHAKQPSGPAHQGENLWTGTRSAYRYDEMIGHWLAEARDYVNRPTPGFSRTGRWQDVSHYSQIMWRKTTRYGCAMASNRRDDFLVCRYSPSGNVVGEIAY